MFTNIQPEIEMYAQELNSAIFKSIAKNGLISLSKIKQECLVNFVLGTSSVQSSICVMLLDFKSCSTYEIDSAIKIALWEEYTGVFGISLERAWPFVSPNKPDILKEQIIQRLCQNIVFVLKPPPFHVTIPEHGTIPGSKRNDAYVYSNNDGPSQERNAFLTGSNLACEKVTKLKTDISFSSEDILYILVPEKLMTLASQHFPNKKIIPVPMTHDPVIINKVPQILNYLHNQEEYPKGISCRVPDYETVLKEKILPKYKDFSLHAVD